MMFSLEGDPSIAATTTVLGKLLVPTDNTPSAVGYRD